MTTFFVNILALGTLFSSVFAITSKNPVISIIFVIATFVQAAGYLIFIGVNFVGISYIVIYVGAIAVLFLFVIMMINIKLTDILETGNQYTKNLPLALAIGSLFTYVIFTIIPFNLNNVPALSLISESLINLNSLILNSNFISKELISIIVNAYYNLSLSDTNITDFTQIETLGYSLYTYGAIFLIILSVILLLAMLATIIISRSNK
uniref:NADH-ubiquinone oxidoreductase chain 6 n=1 Tax=Pleurotus pulmonarius TaxID=28995 RepID=A0A2U8LKP6_PLEPU|nr:NADH dehydrogenase subunit 6 [Pleurotus pulmonarius]AWL21272.1 NADH dehydrogenase subunit 6 [Pleurotus pulmonarius]AWN55963.1 NADH dehydrogenase subunit 6 [Pleurotus pulmonarius]QBS47743.1 NADH dehydrogenase subunit 6 [Pleurotus pulmonarius]QBS47763.1 NADH dehydrogenase subunit 6 [Pleurotus pulmonarius]QCP68325.1 NADH dehydrogenase subunit 6 [Pleurotus pulmonarius]